MICPVCNIDELKEFTLFSSIEKKCDFCDQANVIRQALTVAIHDALIFGNYQVTEEDIIKIKKQFKDSIESSLANINYDMS